MIGLSAEEYKIVTVPAPGKDKNVINDTTWLQLTPDGIKGTIDRKLQGYYAMNEYGELMYVNEKDLKEHFKDEFSRGSNKFQLDTFRIRRRPTNNEIIISADFKLPDYSKKLGNDYFLNLNLFKLYQGSRLEIPERKVPLANSFKYSRRYVTILNIPDGYKLSYLPKSKSYHNKVWGFDLNYEQKDNQVILIQQFDNENMVITNDQFALWNNVLDNLFPLYKEILSLSKI
jgi:hypothetical protein